MIDHGLVKATEESVGYEMEVINAVKASKNRSNLVRGQFEKMLEEHVRIAGGICGLQDTPQTMTSFLSNNRRPEGNIFSRSLVTDHSDLNLKRVCWVLYYSCNALFKNVFGLEMPDYWELKVMEALGVRYEETSSVAKVGKGCVAQFLTKLLNRVRELTKESMKSNVECIFGKISSNSPKEKAYKMVETFAKPEKQSRSLFWIGIKDGHHVIQAPNGDQKRELKIEWKWVSAVCLKKNRNFMLTMCVSSTTFACGS